ncbi:thiol reductant ABC exporter subunit CydC [Acetobacteraceae bacterium LMG 32668]|uniref:Thiol reductant ABC exporter subunit CydC n=1 Tax=Brytella acorum TaxID=2959299 RepID=A0AA35V4K3_9PROT|nr:thiol reductant ABC exporter subunit CydC [Brytella acorum]MDF3624396.1 thiol reductant ABC exporter subunit CydC [Brytella acorum]CAI9119754.1 thiol reductant ABC exporter subunit CydC [Brytella acorum]
MSATRDERQTHTRLPHHSVATALGEILSVWRPWSTRLLCGGLLSILALFSGLALMGAAGLRVSAFATGVGLAIGYVVLRLAGVGRIILRYAERLFAHDAMFRALAGLRVWFFRKLAHGAAAGIGFRRSGDLLSRLVRDVDTLDNLYLRIALPFLGAVAAMPVLLIVGWHASPQLGVTLLVIFLMVAVLLPVIAARIARPAGAEISEAEADLRVAALDFASGMREARAFGAEPRLVDRILARQDVLYRTQWHHARRQAAAGASAFLWGQIAVLVIVCAMAGRVFGGVPALNGVVVLFVTVTAFEGAMGLTRAGVLAAKVGHAAQRVTAVADEAPLATDGTQEAPRDGDVVLENVSFAWSGKSRAVLDGLSMTIRRGERVALLGPSGIGKSTLAALLLKVVEPDEGRITFGGADLRTLTSDSLRARIGWLSQSTHLFDDTIRANLLLATPDAPESALWKALDEAEIGDFVRNLPDGLDSWVGEGGAKVSGGQARRIALARVLLTNAPLLVLDEPATGLDAETERAFLATLNETSRGRTVLLIAHRLLGVEQFDQVWRLNGGKVEAAPV